MLGVGPERKLRRLVVFADYSNISCHFRSINKALRNNLGAVGFEVQQRLVLLTLFSLAVCGLNNFRPKTQDEVFDVASECIRCRGSRPETTDPAAAAETAAGRRRQVPQHPKHRSGEYRRA